MNRIAVLSIAATTALMTTALAAPTPVRLRGTIIAIGAHTLTIKTTSGMTKSLAIGANTHYLKVEKSTLSKVAKGSYIGTATKSVGGQMVALEVVIFPPAMRGAGEGHYAWDKLPDTTTAGTTKTASTMTNGSVTATSSTMPIPKVSSTMTNGNVATTTSAHGDKRLTVTYKGGQKTILVPPTAPIVMFHPGTKSNAVAGAHVFIKGSQTGTKTQADIVAIGVHGVTPPM